MSNSAGDDNNSHTSSGMPAITEQTRRNRRPAAQRRAAKTIAADRQRATTPHLSTSQTHPVVCGAAYLGQSHSNAGMGHRSHHDLLSGVITTAWTHCTVIYCCTGGFYGRNQDHRGLVNELIPALKASTVVHTLMSLIDTPGGLTALILGLIGSLYSASNVVAAFHRAMNRIYDTRQGRPFVYFRFVVFIETVVLITASLALLVFIILGGDFSVRLGKMLGLTQETVTAWNILKWPLILAVLTFLVSQAFYRGPNVQRPRYRLITTGAAIAVVVLFTGLALTGWLLENVTLFEKQLFTVHGILYVLLLVWVAFIVTLAAASWDAEMLRARQLASGYEAGHELQLATVHTWVLRRLDAEAENRRRISEIIVQNYSDGKPVNTAKTPQLSEAGSFWAIKEPSYRPSTGAPFHAAVTPSSIQQHVEDYPPGTTGDPR